MVASGPPPLHDLACVLHLHSTFDPGGKELRLTERELNGLLNQNTDLGQTVRLELDTDAINAYLVVPIPKDFPVGGGQLRHRLAVHPQQLEEGHEREAGRQHRGDVAQELQVVLVQPLQRSGVEANRDVDTLDQRRLQPGVGRGLLQRVGRLLRREEVLDVAEGQPAGVAGPADLLERVPALSQPGHDPRVGGRGGRPPAVAVVLGDQALAGPPSQRPRRHAGALGGFAQRQHWSSDRRKRRRDRLGEAPPPAGSRPAASADGARRQPGGASRAA